MLEAILLRFHTSENGDAWSRQSFRALAKEVTS